MRERIPGMKHSFATAQSTVLPIERAAVFFDGVFSEPRLQHPEGVALGPDGWLWCGTENGEILRIAPDASCIELVARAGGFTLGLAFDGDRALFFCDNKDKAVYRLDLASRGVARFTPPGIRIPNFPVVDARRRRLLVSDSHDFVSTGAGVWSYDLEDGQGGVWYGEPMTFANRMALAPSGDALLYARPSPAGSPELRSARTAGPPAGVSSRAISRGCRMGLLSTFRATFSSAAMNRPGFFVSRLTARSRSISRIRRRICSPIRPTSPLTGRLCSLRISGAGM